MSAAVASVLREAAALVQQGWCTGSSAVNDKGRPCPSSSASAVAWCLTGAVNRAAPGEDDTTYEAFDALRGVLPTVLLARWNDEAGRTQQEVVDALLAAADAAEQGGAS